MSTGRQSALDIQIRGDSKQRSAALQWATPGLYRGLPPPVLNIECGLYAVCTEVLRHPHPSVVANVCNPTEGTRVRRSHRAEQNQTRGTALSSGLQLQTVQRRTNCT